MSLFVGPSYPLATGKASRQRTVNMYLSPIETAEKSRFILQGVPGLVQIDDLGNETRNVFVAGSRMFAVIGDELMELYASGASTSRGTLVTASGAVSMAYGTTQLVIVDGDNGYTFTLSSNTFAQITDPDFPGADCVRYLDGFFVFTRGTTQQATVSAIDDASSIDALDFASAESNPDHIVASVVAHREVVYFGENTIERWFNAGGSYPFSRDSAATAEVGCMAAGSVAILDNAAFWIGRDRNGSGIVFRDVDRQPQRVSNIAVEEALQSSSDLSQAVAYAYQMDGLSFYCINAPGLSATWCYEVASGAWHERCDLDGLGQFKAHRITHAAHFGGVTYAFSGDGIWYRMDRTVNTFDGDPIKRTRISPHEVLPLRERRKVSRFVLDCVTGESDQGDDDLVVELSWSDDGGYTWSDPVAQPYGPVGNYHPRLVWHRLGTARDRVWRVDFDGAAPWAIVSGEAG